MTADSMTGVRRRWLKSLAGVAAGAALPVWAKQTSVAVGTTAPDFSTAGVDGKFRRLSGVFPHQRVTLVHFWATWCGACLEEMPELKRFYVQWHDRGVECLAINHRESLVQARTFARKAALPFPVWLDPEGRISSLYGIAVLPSTLVLDGQGVIRHLVRGEIDVAELQAVVHSLL